MTLQNLWKKLRKYNRKDYRQFQFVILFAEMLISSYLMMLFSPLVQKALPDGGDTIKIATLVFGIAVVGCFVFVWYAARLFLRYKSREIGIFLALGAERGNLSGALFAELGKMMSVYIAEGIAAGAVLSVLVGKIMEKITETVNDYQFAFTIEGFGSAFLFGMALMLLVFGLACRTMKRTDIMEVINEQRRQEPLKKNVTKRYALIGGSCIAAGLFVAVILPTVYVWLTDQYLGGWSNLFYFLAVFGIYRLLVYSVSGHQRGRNPQKYYNNLLNYGMMKFQGASVVRNMLVIVLLIVGGMYAASYVPLFTSTNLSTEDYEAKYSYRYLLDGEVPRESELEKMAVEYDVQIENYREGEFIRIPGSSVNRDTNEDGSEIIEEFIEGYAEYDCLSVSEYEKLTGNVLKIPVGGYYLIQPPEANETFWYHFDDMRGLYCQKENRYCPMEYVGNTECKALVMGNDGLGERARFVVNDSDYESFKAEISNRKIGVQVLFDTKESDGEIPFAEAVFKRLVDGMSADMNHMSHYNPMQEKRVGAENYADMADAAVVDPEVPAKETDWWYAPVLTPLLVQQTLLGLAIRLMLFIYVAVICIAAVGIIGYSRSQSVANSNRQIFEDLKRLGADQEYRKWLLKKQIEKIYVLPTILGVGITVVYIVIILFTNDGVLKPGEISIIFFGLGLGIVVSGFQYLMYKKAFRTVEKIL